MRFNSQEQKSKKRKKQQTVHSLSGDNIWDTTLSQLSNLSGVLEEPEPEIDVVEDSQDVQAETEDEFFGSVRSDIVGVQYYKGTVSNNEMVNLVREPKNKYDPNALRADNVTNEQVGHIKREHAKALSFLVDNNYAKVEGLIPFGANNKFRIPVAISLWGKPDKKSQVLAVLKSHYISVDANPVKRASFGPGVGLGASSSGHMDYDHVVSHRTFVSPSEMESAMDQMFETLDEGDKTTEASPAQAIKTGLYPHQKQALNWMICRENKGMLPPFWEKQGNMYINTLTVCHTHIKPASVCGGILADDMGLGKTLQVISLILTNFVDGKPLAWPMQGTLRSSLGYSSAGGQIPDNPSLAQNANSSDVSMDLTTVYPNKGNSAEESKLELVLEEALKVENIVMPSRVVNSAEVIVIDDCDDVAQKDFKANGSFISVASTSGIKTPSTVNFLRKASTSSEKKMGKDMASPQESLLIFDSKTAGPRGSLIICPLSVISNWVGQFEEHVHPQVHFSLYVYYGGCRKKDIQLLRQQDVVITTYSTLAADFKVRIPLHQVEWLRIVLDEGHIIRNPASLQAKAVYQLNARRKWVITGTPIQNSMKDLWSLVNFLGVKPFTEKVWWNRTIARPLARRESKAIHRVSHLMRSLAMRRTKNQKLNGRPLIALPERHVYLEKITFGEEERAVYEAMQANGQIIIGRYFRQGTLLHHYGEVLAILTRLRQLCCHPLLVASAVDRMLENNPAPVFTEEERQRLINQLLYVLDSGSDQECAICLDSVRRGVITACAHVYCRPCIEAVIENEQPNPKCPLCRSDLSKDQLIEAPAEERKEGEGQNDSGNDGKSADEADADKAWPTPEAWQSSAKIDALMKALTQLRQEDSKVKSIIVSQFTSLLDLIEIPL
ncbi:hypothetical protein EGW08_009514, partial [Elysia chlorotica]